MNGLQVLAWMVSRLLGCLRFKSGKKKSFYRKRLLRDLASVGADSIPIVSVISACTGIILALQSAQQLEKVGAISYVANLVGVTIIRELGPLLTAIIVTGRSGAAFTAEIATMQISEEIDALEVMGIEPVRFLVVPKLIAMLIMVPCLTVWADFVGIFSGGAFSAIALGINKVTYFNNSVEFLKLHDVLAGLVKAGGFAVAITIIGCWQGFLAREGAADVGRKTTNSVVISIFMIILLDLFFTALNFLFR
ncbi:ABC transporter permease [Desulfovibrio sp. JC010]|uniref:MlaE family ABC transporter permease n=1 Tax=Desulfovibrio sp. JC010 TaxID=2593641 RepID=UPI0013D1826B|nr:ABC transporter permease [Desulfovibrio sp. JC010]NDV26197.1 ABC transporter permease [Desulfovibrio sp. JC010]